MGSTLVQVPSLHQDWCSSVQFTVNPSGKPTNKPTDVGGWFKIRPPWILWMCKIWSIAVKMFVQSLYHSHQTFLKPRLIIVPSADTDLGKTSGYSLTRCFSGSIQILVWLRRKSCVSIIHFILSWVWTGMSVKPFCFVTTQWLEDGLDPPGVTMLTLAFRWKCRS